jgi:hypothetical protein
MSSDIGRPRWAVLLDGFSWASRWVRPKSPLLLPASDTPALGERRQSERFLCDLMANCKVVSMVEFQPLPAKVRDMSAGGIGLLLQQPLEVGSFLILELADGTGGKGTRLCVKVMHKTSDDDLWRVGCAIVQETVGPRTVEEEAEGRLLLSP